MTFLKNCWYMGGWSDEVADKPLGRRICDVPLVLFRSSSGEVSALYDRCPHRFAPLSYGDVIDGEMQCRYHGLRFDGAGLCTHNPHGAVNPNAHVRAFPVLERDRAIWVWLGEPEGADPSLVPSHEFFEDVPETAFNKGYLHTRANYLLLVDNILDLSHVDYLHANTIGGGGRDGKGTVTGSQVAIERKGDGILVTWTSDDAIPSPNDMAMKGLADGEKLSRVMEVFWSAPGTMRLFTSTKAGERPSQDARNCHVMTPETDRTTHYFFASSRNFSVDDAEMNDFIATSRRRVFTEDDEWMCHGVDERMEGADFMALQPALLSTDTASVQVRRSLARMIKAEEVA